MKIVPFCFFALILSSCNLHSQTGEETITTTTIHRKYLGPLLKQRNSLSIEDRIAFYRELKRDSFNYYQFDNLDDLTMYGYSLLWNDQIDDALAFFHLISEENPEYANGYDNLGETYLALGDKGKATYYYQLAADMDTNNFGARYQLKRIADSTYVFDAPTFARVYSREDYVKDLSQLADALMEIHPNALLFTTEAEFNALVYQKIQQVTDSTIFGEFVWHCSEVVSAVNCSHTGIGNFNVEWDLLPVELRFPLEVRLLEGKLIVVDNLGNENRVSVGSEIISINGVDVKSIIQGIYRHIPSQGHIETYKRYEFEGWASGMIPYELGFPKTYSLKLKDVDGPVVLNTAKNHDYYTKPLRTPFSKRNLNFKELDEKSSLLTIQSFNYYAWNNLDVFTSYIDSCFNVIKTSGTENLIIDLRYNLGGSQHAAMHLLKHLMNAPFYYYANMPDNIDGALIHPFENNYSGNLYFLINGMGNSTTGHFMSLVEEHNLGLIIGEELGSNQLCTAGQTTVRLINTGLQAYIANSTVESYVSERPKNRGILPNHSIDYTTEDYFSGRDLEKEFALKLIENHKD